MIKSCTLPAGLMLAWVNLFCAPLPADEEGMSRTSWGRFGWWEASVNASNRRNIDGLLAYNVTLDGLAGFIQTRADPPWKDGPPYMFEPVKGCTRIWNIRLKAADADQTVITLSRAWRFATDPNNVGLQQGWQKADFNDSKWRMMMVGPLDDAETEAGGLLEKEKGAGWGMSRASGSTARPGTWEAQGLEYDGIAWYRLQAKIPPSWKGEKIYFHCYGIDDEDQTFVNGVKIGETTIAKNPGADTAERKYEIPAQTIRWGEMNAFVVRVRDDHGFGGMAGSAVELMRAGGGARIDSIMPDKPGEAPRHVKGFDWVTKRIELDDCEMTYSLASALVRVKPKGKSAGLSFDMPLRHAAVVTSQGVQVVSPRDGAFYERKRDGELMENWILLWHGNAVGNNADLPVLLVLQGKPERIAVAENVITLVTQKPSFNLGPPFGLRRFSGSETERWTQGLPKDMIEACRFWSRAALAYPTSNKEFYSVDHDSGTVTITEKYEFETVPDDWGTKPMKIAAVPPILACLLDAGYPGKMLTSRTDPGFVTYCGPFAATVDSDTAKFELPIPIEDSLAALETPGAETEMDNLTRGVASLYQRWTNREWSRMGVDDNQSKDIGAGPVDYPESVRKGAGLPNGKILSFDEARERALSGNYEVIGVPKDHKPGAPLPKPHWNPLSASIHVAPLLIVDERVRSGVLACIRQMGRGLAGSLQDETFLSGVWRVEIEPTCKKKMTYLANYRYENIPNRYNGEAPYDFVAAGVGVPFGFFEAALWTGQWDIVRKNWHRILQISDPAWRNHDWASAACDNKDSRPNSSVDITWDHAAGIDGLARCAYAIGDVKTYDFLCYLRARLALVTVSHEALQRYLQPVLFWPDHYFAGHVGEPYPPYWSGLLPEGGIAKEWDEPYPVGAGNQTPWRFNNASVPSPGAPLHWMAMTMPKETRWFLDRIERFVPHAYDGERWSAYAPDGKVAPPYFPHVMRDIGANQTALRFFIDDPAVEVDRRFDRLGRSPALAPWSIEMMTTHWGRGHLPQLLATRSCPLWASAWEPRVIWKGSYDSKAGTATIVVQPGETPLRFRGVARESPSAVSLNGSELPGRSSLKQTRAGGGWYYDSSRRTIHLISEEKNEIKLEFHFKPDPNAPAMLPRMASEKPALSGDENLLVNGSFDTMLTNARHSPCIGAPTGPYLYVNRWLAGGNYHDAGAFGRRYLEAVIRPIHAPGLALRMHAFANATLHQNVPAQPGPHRLTAYVQRGPRPWDSTQARLTLTLKALSTKAGGIDEPEVNSRIVFPETLAPNRWIPIVIELNAPGTTDAMQVSIAFEPILGEGDLKKEFPVYVDDVELVRVPRLESAVQTDDVGVLAGYAPQGDSAMGRRFTTRHLGDLQNDYWPDDSTRPAEPQLTKGAQSFVLKKKSEIWMVDLLLSNTHGDKIKNGMDLRMETNVDEKTGAIPSGELAWAGATASVPACPSSGKYVTFTFKDRKALPPGRYWLVFSKKPESNPSQRLVYGIHGAPVESYPDGGYAEWEKETTNGFDGRWRPYAMNAFFQVIGQVVE